MFGAIVGLLLGFQRQRSTDLKLNRIIKECLDAKRMVNLRPVYLKELDRYLSRFSEFLGNPRIPAVMVGDIERWLARPEWSAGTRATGINRLSSLFSFAVRRGYVKSNPVDRLDRIRLERPPPRILSPTEAQSLLDATRDIAPALLPYIILGLFAGIRPAELDRLDFADVLPERRIVKIDAASSKVRQRRIVQLEDAAVLWLQALECPACGPIAPTQKRRKLRRIRKAMGWSEWPKDILRHSSASYWMAKEQNAAKVADWLGNSVGVLLRHYREIVTSEDSLAFWSIRP